MSICDRCLKNNPIDELAHTCQPKGNWKLGMIEGYQNAIEDVTQSFIAYTNRTGKFAYTLDSIVQYLDDIKASQKK